MAKRIVFFLVLSIMLSACNTGRKLATRFVMKERNINVMILPPPGLIKKYYPYDPASVNPDSLQQFPLSDALFLNELNDTAYVNYFMRSLRYHLRQFQVNVYGPEQLDTFFTLDSVAFIFSAAQMELIEYKDKHQESAVLDTTYYRVALPRNNIENSIWFEFNMLNHAGRPMEVLYSLQRSSDYYDGRFFYDWRTAEVIYNHTPYHLESSDVYQLAYFAGEKNAQYIFDYIMNVYVMEQSKRKRDKPGFFQYDNKRHAIRRAYDDRFIRLQ